MILYVLVVGTIVGLGVATSVSYRRFVSRELLGLAMAVVAALAFLQWAHTTPLLNSKVPVVAVQH